MSIGLVAGALGFLDAQVTADPAATVIMDVLGMVAAAAARSFGIADLWWFDRNFDADGFGLEDAGVAT